MAEFDWLTQAQATYEPSTNDGIVSLQTDISRGSDAIHELDLLITKGELSQDKYNILLVGVGQYCRTCIPETQTKSPFEVYNFAAFFEAKGLDYSITIVDIDPNAILDVETRTHIFISESYLKDRPSEYSSCMNWRKNAWDYYLEQTDQQDEITFEQMDGLEVNPQGSLDALLEEGVNFAAIPSTFAQKLENGDIKTIVGDIATVELPEQYHFIGCSNVLYMLPQAGQMLAVHNMLNSLTKPGMIFLWDPTEFKTRSVSTVDDYDKGWLTENVRKDLGIRRYHGGGFTMNSRQLLLTNFDLTATPVTK